MTEELIPALDRAFAEEIYPASPEPIKRFLYKLMGASRQGHLCVRNEEISLPSEIAAVGSLDLVLPTTPIVRDKSRYYLQRNWVLETSIVRDLLRLREGSPQQLFDASLFAISPQLLPQQAAAVQSAFTQSLTVVSGGPGTGKTFTAGQLIQSFVRALRSDVPFLRIKIAAPTGKAADRLLQGIPTMDRLQVEAMTLHRLLRLQPGRTRLFEERTIEADLILVDEASMIDATLFAHLLAAAASGTRLILLGDADQLPPVDGGSVFADLADLFAVRLQHCHRTKEEGLQNIYEASRTGTIAPLAALLEPFPKDLIAWIEPLLGNLFFTQRPDPTVLLKLFDQIRLICPLRKGPMGVDAINAALLKRQQMRLTIGRWWAAPILVTSNDSQLKLYNGTPGVLIGLYQGGSLPRGSEMAAFADGRSFPLNQLPGYEIAYALSAHKSQGSEFDQVICCLPPGSEEFGREALYTALTRAKKGVRLVGDLQTLEKMIAAPLRQESGFRERMTSALEGR